MLRQLRRPAVSSAAMLPGLAKRQSPSAAAGARPAGGGAAGAGPVVTASQQAQISAAFGYVPPPAAATAPPRQILSDPSTPPSEPGYGNGAHGRPPPLSAGNVQPNPSAHHRQPRCRPWSASRYSCPLSKRGGQMRRLVAGRCCRGRRRVGRVSGCHPGGISLSSDREV